jgi:hypothetical protein
LPLGGDPLDTTALGYPLLTTYIKAVDIYKIVGLSLSMGMDLAHGGASANSDYIINFAGIYVVVGGATSGWGFDIYLCPEDTTASPNNGINGNIPTGAGTFIDPTNATITYKVAVDLYTLYMMYGVAAINPAYTIYTYNAAGTTVVNATGNRVWTSGNTTMRGWQAIVGWSWAASGHATSNLSVLPAAGGFGYTSSSPYRRVQLP